jgi:hypothetical protein
LTWDDQGDYECKTSEGDYYRFRLYMLDTNDSEPSRQTTKRNEKTDVGSTMDIDAKLGSTIELACGQPSEKDGYIEWTPVNGVRDISFFFIDF